MSEKRCPYCHEWIDSREYAAHCRAHQQLRPDGQYKDYVTLPSDERELGPLDGVPRVYRHNVCGRCTGMPEEIIRTYLKNPFIYFSDRSFCTGCGRHVPCRELVWVETGENMQEYNDRLRAAHPEMHPNPLIRLLAPVLKLFRSPSTPMPPGA
jgi:hypothetical protein